MTKPIVSERFDLDDIRAIRDYNSARHLEMTHEEIIAEGKAVIAEFLQAMQHSQKSA